MKKKTNEIFYNGNSIKIRSDGFVNLSDIESICSHLSIYDWMMHENTSTYIDEVSKKIGRSALEYTYGYESNAYGHSDLAVNYALLASKDLGLWLDVQLIFREKKLAASIGEP